MLIETNTRTDLATETPPTRVPPSMANNIYCTIDDFAEVLQVSRGTVFTWLKAGLPSLSVGRTRRIIVERAFRWLEAGGADQSRRSTRARRTTS